MSEKERIEGNKLIAEFMGYEKITVGYYGTDDETEWQRKNREWMNKTGMEDVGDYMANIPEDSWYFFNELAYHSSFDWLMPVVEKIEAFKNDINSKRYTIKIDNNACLIYSADYDNRTITAKTKIQATWLAVIEFIKWYNQTNQHGGKNE